jgi:hypothetical protein
MSADHGPPRDARKRRVFEQKGMRESVTRPRAVDNGRGAWNIGLVH